MLWKKFASDDSRDVLAEYNSSPQGLSLHEATNRLKNTEKSFFSGESSPLWTVLTRRSRSVFLYLLLAAASLSFFLRDYLEGILILLFISINLGLETYQEHHCAKATRLLKRYLVVHARVRRSGEVVRVERAEIVPGDIVLVETGDRLLADMRFLETSSLEIDESLITGESGVALKSAELLHAPPTEMYEAKNIGFAGTVVKRGRGEGVVFAVGEETILGDSDTFVSEKERESAFEKSIQQFRRFILKLVFFTLTIIYFANIFIRGDEASSIGLLIFSLALAVSVIPEALPVVLAAALSRGSLRLAEKKVVVKRLSAIEDLGSIGVLCCDKTGTLTENMLSVTHVNARDERRCLELAFASCLEAPMERGKLHDAFDLALWQALTEVEHEKIKKGKRLDAIPFDPERRRNSVLFESEGVREIIVRGAPEEIIHLSNNVDTYTARSLMQWVAEAGFRGERVLAVASRPFSERKKYSLYQEQHLNFIGLIAFSDTLKKTAKDTINKARLLNVEVKIITGDSKEVAGFVAHAIGLTVDPSDVVTGKDLEVMTEDTRRRTIFSSACFARVSPEQKYEIIKTLQEKHTVGFLGDGMNDARALKLADVAIVVQGASDIARESSDIVLLQKGLESVVDGIKEGRIIFANILKYLKITLTSTFGNFYSVALASLFLPFLPLLPIQILLLKLISDFPMIALATDNVDHEELEKPKNYQVHSIVLMAVLLGGVSSIFDFTLFGSFYRVSPETLQTAWFLFSVVTEIILIFSLRTKFAFFRASHASHPLIYLSIVMIVVALVLPFIPSISSALHFVLPTPKLLLFVGVLALIYFFATEAVKNFYYRHVHNEYLPPRKEAV